MRRRHVPTWLALAACLALVTACGGETRRYSIAELEEVTKCGGGTFFGPSQADKHALRTRACASESDRLRLNTFKTNDDRDEYATKPIVNPISGKQTAYKFFVVGDRWAVACTSEAAQAKFQGLTHGEESP